MSLMGRFAEAPSARSLLGPRARARAAASLMGRFAGAPSARSLLGPRARARAAASLKGFFLVLAAAACDRVAPTTAAPDAQAAPDAMVAVDAAAANTAPLRLPSGVAPLAYAIELAIDPAKDTFTGRARVQINFDAPTTSFLMHAENLTVRSAKLGAASVRFVPLDEHGLVRAVLSSSIASGEAELDVTYEAQVDPALDGVFATEEGDDRYIGTQFEATLARRCFPGFDEPRFKTPFELTLTVPKDMVAVANTPVLDERIEGETKVVRFQKTAPLPTYLVAFAVGPFDVVAAPDIPPNEIRKTPLPLRAIVAHGKGPGTKYALAHVPELVVWLERWFAIPYPFEKLDLIAPPGFNGGMENAGAILFREYHLLIDEKTAPIDQLQNFASIVAHEVSHMWFGDLTTMPWWDDLWLNEAFATWMEARALSATHPELEAEAIEQEDAIEAMRIDSLAASRRVREPIEAHDDIVNAFDDITYLKGSAVVHMFERYLGPEVFKAGVYDFMSTHRFQSATALDFLAALEKASKREVSASFTSFLEQPGLPMLDVAVSCTSGQAMINVSQSRWLPLGSKAEAKQLWRIPMCAKIKRAGAVETRCELVVTASQAIALEGATCPEWVQPNADAAGYYRFGLPPELLAKAAGATELSALDRAAIADAIEASFETGRIDARAGLELLAPFAKAPSRALADAPMTLVELLRDHVASPALAPKVEAYARSLYGVRVAELLRSPNSGGTRFEQDLFRFAAVVGRDSKVRVMLGRAGRAHLLGKKELVASNLVELAVEVAVDDGGGELFDRAVKMFAAARDPRVRREILFALARVERPELAERTRALLLDERLRPDEVIQLMHALPERAKNAEGNWRWLVANLERFQPRVSDEVFAEVAGLPAALCSEQARAEVEAFAPKLAAIPGGPRQIRAAMESIELCLALVKAQRANADAFFSPPNESPRGVRRAP